MPGKEESDRRATRRFHIELELRYKPVYECPTTETGRGATVNVSSGGLLIRTDRPLARGVEVEVAMNWPVLLNGRCPLKLVVFGCVLRSNNRGAAIAIERYEFRTQSTRAIRGAFLPRLFADSEA
jgi:c-di-GMP-binding flagellar brake protein YcgR